MVVSIAQDWNSADREIHGPTSFRRQKNEVPPSNSSASVLASDWLLHMLASASRSGPQCNLSLSLRLRRDSKKPERTSDHKHCEQLGKSGRCPASVSFKLPSSSNCSMKIARQSPTSCCSYTQPLTRHDWRGLLLGSAFDYSVEL